MCIKSRSEINYSLSQINCNWIHPDSYKEECPFSYVPYINDQVENDKYRRLRPPTKQVNELVHRFLFIGKARFQTFPVIIKPTAARIMYRTLRNCLSFRYFDIRNSPVNIPSKAVDIAGILLNIPSGSWFPR